MFIYICGFKIILVCLFFLVVWFFETGFLCATALVVLELAYFCLQSVSKFLMKK